MGGRLKSFCIVIIIKNLPLLHVTVTGVNFIGMIVRRPFVLFRHSEWFQHFGIRFGFGAPAFTSVSALRHSLRLQHFGFSGVTILSPAF